MLNQKMLATGAISPAAPDRLRPYGSAAVGIGPFRRPAAGGVATIHAGGQARAAAAPGKILQAFNTWAFKREQPDSIPLLVAAVSGAAQLGRPVPFVLYWGKGPRCDLAEPDTACLDYLAALASRVRQVYEPGASLRLIFTDTHATLNGHAPQEMEAYFNAVEGAARRRPHGNAPDRTQDRAQPRVRHRIRRHCAGFDPSAGPSSTIGWPLTPSAR